MKGLTRARMLFATAALTLVAVVAAGEAAVSGGLTQKIGAGSCVADGAIGDCQNGIGLNQPQGVAVSPDGASVYSVSMTSNAVTVMDRSPATGAITQKTTPNAAAGCIADTNISGCTDGNALQGPIGVAVSPDGESVYVASQTSDAIAIFDRDTGTGALTQKAGAEGCISLGGAAGCTSGVELDGVGSVTVSADGDSVYATAQTDDAIVVLDRDDAPGPAEGELTQKAGAEGCVGPGGCVAGIALDSPRSVAVSPDGENVYVASALTSDAVGVFDRSPNGELDQQSGTDACVSESGGACEDGVALDGARSVTVSADGENVYAAAADSDAVAIFDRDTGTGELEQQAGADACISETGTAGACENGQGFDLARSVVASEDGDSVYVSAQTSEAITILDRDPADGALDQRAGAGGCISDDGAPCTEGDLMGVTADIAISPDDQHIYAAAQTNNVLLGFDRDLDAGPGESLQKPAPDGCISRTGSSGQCENGRALHQVTGLALSPDGESLYAANNSGSPNFGLANIDRDPADGTIDQVAGAAGCFTQTGSDGEAGSCGNGIGLEGAESVVVSPDGEHAYAASPLASDAITIFDRNTTTGELTQKAGLDGCISNDGNDNAAVGVCQNGVEINSPNDLAISPDGASLYVAAGNGFSPESDAIAVFDIDPSNGELTQKTGLHACVSETGSGGNCADGKALDGASGVAVSADGASVYVSSATSDAIAIFDREPATGALDQQVGTAGCVSETGSAGACADGKVLDGATSVTVAPDGRAVYATSSGNAASTTSNAVAIFDRNLSTGELGQKPGTAGCISQNGAAGACVDGRGLNGASAVAVSADNANVYVASGVGGSNTGWLTAYERDGVNELTQLDGGFGCLTSDAEDGCSEAIAVNQLADVAVSPDARNVYTASADNGDNGAVAAFDRDPVPGPGFSASTSRIDFGEISAGTDSEFQTVTVVNTGTADLTITSTSLTTGTPSVFELGVDGCLGATLNPTESCSVEVRFSPTAQGAATTKLRFTHDAPGGQTDVDLLGEGTVPAPEFSVAPTAINFGNQTVGSSSAMQTVTVTNTGSLNLSVTGAGLSGGNAGDFVEQNDNCAGQTVAPAATCTVQVGFAPTVAGARASELVFTHNAPGSPDEVDLSGAGTTVAEPPPPPPPPAGDTDPPETQITKGPKPTTKTKKKSAKVSFEFSADEAGASFECKLDTAAFAACSSPFSAKAKKGSHAFSVRATDAAGNVDATPATQSFKVKRKKKKRK